MTEKLQGVSWKNKMLYIITIKSCLQCTVKLVTAWLRNVGDFY